MQQLALFLQLCVMLNIVVMSKEAVTCDWKLPGASAFARSQIPLAYSDAFEGSFEDRSSTFPVILVYISITSSTVVSKWEVAS